jgi:hypothetical protein
VSNLRERTKTVEVPPNTGIEGFLHVVRQVVAMPRVQKIVIDKSGRVTYAQLAPADGEEPNVGFDFSHLEPYHVIRNARMSEVSYPEEMVSAAVVATMLDLVTSNGFSPIAFIVSPSTLLWTWLYFGSDLELKSRDALYGFPLYVDRHVPDTALVLGAGVDGATALIDTKWSLKVEMRRLATPDAEEVDIL